MPRPAEQTSAFAALRALARPEPVGPMTAAMRTAATSAAMLAVARWRTVAASATTDQHAPLFPSLDPANAGVTVPVAWAGLCRSCAAPIWAAVVPGKTVPRLCAACRADELAAGRPVAPSAP